MKTLTLLISLFFLSSFCYSQTNNQRKVENIVGVFSSYEDTRNVGQQVAQQGVTGTRYPINYMSLTIGGKKFKLYKYSEKEISDFEKKNPNLQQEQKPLFVIFEDYYIKDKIREDGKYCLFTGIIDNEKQIIYNASFVKVYSENEIIKALMNYSKGEEKKND